MWTLTSQCRDPEKVSKVPRELNDLVTVRFDNMLLLGGFSTFS